MSGIGLSPRVWGNHLSVGQLGWIVRPIPTCVGQPLPILADAFPSTAYPHVCGATSSAYLATLWACGLSPRVWGNLSADGQYAPTRRPIPTCVGQPALYDSRVAGTRAYPHVCGATLNAMRSIRVRLGLSPRVWGNLLSLPPVILGLRPIPTCVGQPTSLCENGMTFRAYPHVCGATTTGLCGAMAKLGLSPRVWGNLGQRFSIPYAAGPIPTCVGQPMVFPPSTHAGRAYPHVCGATNASDAVANGREGPIPTCVGQPSSPAT